MPLKDCICMIVCICISICSLLAKRNESKQRLMIILHTQSMDRIAQDNSLNMRDVNII